MVRNTVLRYLKARLKLVIIISNLCDGLALFIGRDKDVLNWKHWIFVLIVFNLILSHGEWFFFISYGTQISQKITILKILIDIQGIFWWKNKKEKVLKVKGQHQVTGKRGSAHAIVHTTSSFNTAQHPLHPLMAQVISSHGCGEHSDHKGWPNLLITGKVTSGNGVDFLILWAKHEHRLSEWKICGRNS